MEKTELLSPFDHEISQLRQNPTFQQLSMTFNASIKELHHANFQKGILLEKNTELLLDYTLQQQDKAWNQLIQKLRNSYHSMELNVKMEESSIKTMESRRKALDAQSLQFNNKKIDLEGKMKKLNIDKRLTIEMVAKQVAIIQKEIDKIDAIVTKNAIEMQNLENNIQDKKPLIIKRKIELLNTYTEFLKREVNLTLQSQLEAYNKDIVELKQLQQNITHEPKVPIGGRKREEFPIGAGVYIEGEQILNIETLNTTIVRISQKIKDLFLQLQQNIRENYIRLEKDLQINFIGQEGNHEELIQHVMKKTLKKEELEILREEFAQIAFDVFYITTPLLEQGDMILESSENVKIKPFYDEYSKLYFDLIQTYPSAIRINEANWKYFEDHGINQLNLFNYAKEMKWYYTYAIEKEDHDIEYFRHMIERILFSWSNEDFIIPHFSESVEKSEAQEESEEQTEGEWTIISDKGLPIQAQKTLDAQLNFQIPLDSDETNEKQYKLMIKDYPNSKFLRELGVQTTKLKNLCEMGGEINERLIEDSISMVMNKVTDSKNKVHLLKIISWRLYKSAQKCYCDGKCSGKPQLKPEIDLEKYIESRIVITDKFEVPALISMVHTILIEYGLDKDHLGKYAKPEGTFVHVFGIFYLLIKPNVVYLQTIRDKNITTYENWYYK